MDQQSVTEFEHAQTTSDPAKHGELLAFAKAQSSDIRTRRIESRSKFKTLLMRRIKKVTEDLEGLRFNTAISALMVFINDAMTWETKPRAVLRDFLILLQPFAPHIAEELWSKLGETNSLGYQPWPKFDPALLVENTLEIPVQVNGKLQRCHQDCSGCIPGGTGDGGIGIGKGEIVYRGQNHQENHRGAEEIGQYCGRLRVLVYSCE